MYGGYSYRDAGISKHTVNNNSITANNGTGSNLFGGYAREVMDAIEGGILNINNNGVHVINGKYSGIVGGSAYVSTVSEVNVTNNKVKLSGGEANDIYGGLGQTINIYGPSVSMNVSNNSVEISGGIAWGPVYGAAVYSLGHSILSNNNNITISGGIIQGDIFGGHGNSILSEMVTVNNNTVTLIGDKITIGKNDADGNVISYGSLYGGYIVSRGSVNTDFDKVISGNTLNLNGYRGTVEGLYNFENYNWILPKDIVNGDTLITIAGSSGVDLTYTKHTLAMYNDGNRLNGGDTVTMISKTSGSFTSQKYQIVQGHFIVCDATLAQIDQNGQNALVLKINGKDDTSPSDDTAPNIDKTPAGHINPKAKAFSEGRAAALGFVSQGNDLIATAGIDNIRIMVRANDNEVNRPAFIPFMITNGSSQRYDTGSHVDVDGFNMAMGLAGGFEFASGHKATIGAFFEYGRGTYDTYNSFTNYATVHGDGDTHYTGGGVFGRIDFAGTGLGRVNKLAVDQADGLYIEASIRGGRIHTDFDGGDNLVDREGYRGTYTSKAGYYGGHAAAGYVLNFDEKQALDVYGRYLWLRINSDTVNVGKDKRHFNNATSSRIQLGGRYSYAYNDQFKPYVGAAYEHEFEGDIAATAYNLKLDKPSLKGDTGIFEAGFLLHPVSNNQALSINVNGQAYVGQRQGGGGGFMLKYQF